MNRLETLRAFVGPAQRHCLYSAMQGEEGEYFRAMVKTLIDRLQAMPDEELLAALQAVHAGFMDGSIKWARPRQADSDPYHPANTLMTAALAKATQS